MVNYIYLKIFNQLCIQERNQDTHLIVYQPGILRPS